MVAVLAMLLADKNAIASFGVGVDIIADIADASYLGEHVGTKSQKRRDGLRVALRVRERARRCE